MITPQQFRALRGSRAAEIGRNIDTAIESAALLNLPLVHLGVSYFDPELVEAVLRDYRATGWKAELVYDQRDGNYVRLEAV